MSPLNQASAIYLGATRVDAVYLGPNKVWSAVSDAYGPAETLYGDVPAQSGPADPNTFSIGNQIQIVADGRITAIRFYRWPGAALSRYVAIWGAAGEILADGYTSGDVAGWNVFPIPPLAVTAGQVIRTSYGYAGNAAAGSFSYNPSPQTSVSPNLVWLSGCYSTPVPSGGDDDYPANTIQPNNYYADIIYQERLSPAAPEPIEGSLAASERRDTAAVSGTLGATGPFDPLGLGGLAVWLDASALALADGAAVLAWPNAGSGPDTIVVGAPPATLRANAPNGKPVVRMLQGAGRFRLGPMGVNRDYTLLYVGHLYSTATTGRMLSAGYPEGGNFLIGSWNGFSDVMYAGSFIGPQIPQTADWRLYSADSSTPENLPRFWSNGVPLGAFTIQATEAWGGLLSLNGYDWTGVAETCDCEIAELLLYDRKLTDADRQDAEAYLYEKWFQTGPPPAVTGALDAREPRDQAALAGNLKSSGVLAAIERPDVAALAGSLTLLGQVTARERPDGAAVAATLSTSGSLAKTENADTARLTGGLSFSGSLAATERRDTAHAVLSAVSFGALAATEARDGAVLRVTLSTSGALAASERSDRAALAGLVYLALRLAATEARDGAAIRLNLNTTGTLAAAEIRDRFAAKIVYVPQWLPEPEHACPDWEPVPAHACPAWAPTPVQACPVWGAAPVPPRPAWGAPPAHACPPWKPGTMPNLYGP